MCIKSDKIILNLFALVVAITVLSQIEVFAPFLRPLMYIGWVVLFVNGSIFSGLKFSFSSFTSKYLLVYIVFSCIIFILGIFEENYLDGVYFTAMRIPLIVLMIANMYSPIFNKKNINKLIFTYIFSSVLFALWVNYTFFYSYQEWLNMVRYAFVQKNSAAQIWGTCILLLLFYFEYHTNKSRYFGYTIACYLFIMCAISQCRTAMLGLVLAGLYYLFYSKMVKTKYILYIFCGLGLLLLHPAVQAFFSQALLLNKYAGTDMNTMSSGRLVLYKIALNNFAENIFFGSGSYYVDCSYIMILAEAGIVGFLFIETIWLNRIIDNMNSSNLFISSITIFYIIESCLEGLPPFGPGVSSFMFWLLCAVLIDKKTA